MTNVLGQAWGRRVAGHALGALIGLVLAFDARADPLVDTPVYNPETKSYFELVNFNRGVRGHTWRIARLTAMTRVFKGVAGRLAIVPSPSVSDFLRDTFKPHRAAWIGLQYNCLFGRLFWVDGSELEGVAYQNWDSPWNLNGVKGEGHVHSGCSHYAYYYPVHVWPFDQGFRWNANGTFKEFPFYFVEYVTGGE